MGVCKLISAGFVYGYTKIIFTDYLLPLHILSFHASTFIVTKENFVLFLMTTFYICLHFLNLHASPAQCIFSHILAENVIPPQSLQALLSPLGTQNPIPSYILFPHCVHHFPPHAGQRLETSNWAIMDKSLDVPSTILLLMFHEHPKCSPL